MDIDALRSFIAFVDTGSFTRAAKQTFRTQSAISMQMKKLEEETGQTLFEKTGRTLALSQDGQTLVSYARRILALHDEVLGELKEKDTHPPLIIGCPDDYAESILPDIVTLLRELHPNQSIRVHCDSSTQLRLLLDKGDIHLAILTRAPEKEEGYLLRHDSGVWVHGGFPELVNNSVLPLILYEADCKFHSTAIDGLEKQNRDYRLICSSSSATAIKSLLRKGMGISAMARSSVNQDLVIAEHPDLPPLPAVDIVLAITPTPHPLFGAAKVAKVCAQYHNDLS